LYGRKASLPVSMIAELLALFVYADLANFILLSRAKDDKPTDGQTRQTQCGSDERQTDGATDRWTERHSWSYRWTYAGKQMDKLRVKYTYILPNRQTDGQADMQGKYTYI